MMNLVSRCSERNPDVLASTTSESLGKTRYESRLTLSSWNEQHLRTVRLVKDAYSSSYSEWNIDEKWSCQHWKPDEFMEVWTGRPVWFAQHTDRLIVDYDDIDSNTVTELDISLKSSPFLHRVNDRVRKMLDDQSSNGECLCLRHYKHLFSWEKNTQTIYAPSKIQRTISQWNRCLTCLKSW